MPVIFAKSDTGTGLISSDIDHGNITGLADNDHTQYVTGVSGSTPLRGGGQTLGFDSTVIDHDALTNYTADEHFTEGSIDHGSIAGLSDNDHTQYVTGVSGSTPLRAGGQTLGFDETVIDHGNLANYVIGQHRVINDVGMSATELWSASQIESRVVTATGSLTTDHGALTGLSDDDHTQYFLADSSRAFSGNLLPNASGTLDIGSLALPFKDLYLTGSSLYLDGIKTLYTDGNNIVLASPDGSIVISGTINLSDGVINHDELTGLADDDHTQYHNNARGDARYYTETELDAGQLDNRYHTEAEITTISGDLQTNIDALTHNGFADYVATEHVAEASIDHGSIAGLGDDDHPQYINNAEMATISGDISVEIDSDISTHAAGASHDARYYTETEVDTWRNSVTQTEMGYVNGVTSDIQTQLDDMISSSEMTTISGDLSSEIDADISTHEAGSSHDSRYYTETELDAGQLDNRYYTETELDAGQLDNRYHTEAEITTISGDLVAQLHTRSHAITSASDHTAGNWKVVYTDGSGDVQELALGSTSGDSLVTNGASAAPSWTTISGGGGGLSSLSWTAETKTADYTITTDDFNKTIRMNSADDKIFSLPSVGASEDGERITLAKIAAGKVTIAAADADKIDSGSAGGTLFNNQAGEIYANVTLEYVHAIVTWIHISGRGTWSTT